MTRPPAPLDSRPSSPTPTATTQNHDIFSDPDLSAELLTAAAAVLGVALEWSQPTDAVQPEGRS